jgi:hypothetical protein
MATDTFSKEGIQIEEVKEGTHFEFYHNPFIDLMGQASQDRDFQP